MEVQNLTRMKTLQAEVEALASEVKSTMAGGGRQLSLIQYDQYFYNFSSRALHSALMVVNLAEVEENIKAGYSKLVKALKEAAKDRPDDDEQADENEKCYEQGEMAKFLNSHKPAPSSENRGQLYHFLQMREKRQKQKDVQGFMEGLNKITNVKPHSLKGSGVGAEAGCQTDIVWVAQMKISEQNIVVLSEIQRYVDSIREHQDHSRVQTEKQAQLKQQNSRQTVLAAQETQARGEQKNGAKNTKGDPKKPGASKSKKEIAPSKVVKRRKKLQQNSQSINKEKLSADVTREDIKLIQQDDNTQMGREKAGAEEEAKDDASQANLEKSDHIGDKISSPSSPHQQLQADETSKLNHTLEDKFTQTEADIYVPADIFQSPQAASIRDRGIFQITSNKLRADSDSKLRSKLNQALSQQESKEHKSRSTAHNSSLYAQNHSIDLVRFRKENLLGLQKSRKPGHQASPMDRLPALNTRLQSHLGSEDQESELQTEEKEIAQAVDDLRNEGLKADLAKKDLKFQERRIQQFIRRAEEVHLRSCGKNCKHLRRYYSYLHIFNTYGKRFLKLSTQSIGSDPYHQLPFPK